MKKLIIPALMFCLAMPFSVLAQYNDQPPASDDAMFGEEYPSGEPAPYDEPSLEEAAPSDEPLPDDEEFGGESTLEEVPPYDEAPLMEGTSVVVTGTLEQAMAIGGETTGWRVRLDQPLDGRYAIEVDPAGRDVAQLVGQHVIVAGTVINHAGVERGQYPVISAREIEKVPE